MKINILKKTFISKIQKEIKNTKLIKSVGNALEKTPKTDEFKKIPTKKLTADEITDLVLRNI